MKLPVTALASLMLLTNATTTRAQDADGNLTVFVTSAPATRVESREAGEAALAGAATALKALKQSISAEHGDKRNRWPAAVEEHLRAAEEAVKLAAVPVVFNAVPEELVDSVRNVKDAIVGAGLRGRRKHIVLVESPADAHLIVEIQGRSSSRGTGGLFGRQYSVLFAIKPGAKLTTEQFSAIPRTIRHGALVARPTAQDTPAWLWEAVGTGSWKLAGAIAASLVDDFINEHSAVLTRTSSGLR